jgi:hypothetical protein
LSLCKRVLDNPAKASLLLPTRGGLLFGSTEYDEKYFENITHTIEILEPVIKFITDKAAKKDYTYDILYIAYW